MIDAHEASNSIGMELIDCIELPVLIVDRDLTLVSFNPAAAKLLALTGSDRGRQLRSIQMFAGVKNLPDTLRTCHRQWVLTPRGDRGRRRIVVLSQHRLS